MRKNLFLLFLTPILLCPLAACSNSLESKAIDPQTIKIFNYDKPLSFNSVNSWFSPNQNIFDNLFAKLAYEDMFGRRQGCLLIDENTQKNLVTSQPEYATAWFDANNVTKGWMNDSSTIFTAIFRNNADHYPEGSDWVGGIPWTDSNGQIAHPLTATQFNQDITQPYYTCPEDLMNTLIETFNPYNYNMDTGALWIDELMSYGEDLQQYLIDVSGVEYPKKDKLGNTLMPWTLVDENGNKNDTGSKVSDELYDSDFDISHDKNHVSLIGTDLVYKSAVAEENCATLIRACLDGTYKKWNSTTKSLESIRLEADNKKVKIPHHEISKNNYATGEFEIIDEFFGDANNCNFIKFGIGDGKSTKPNPKDPWFIQINFGTIPKPFFLELISNVWINVMADRAVVAFDDYGNINQYRGAVYLNLQNWDKGLYNGPYKIKNYIPSYLLDLTANENFPEWQKANQHINDFWYKKGKIKNVKIYLSGKKTESDEIDAFRSGDVTHAMISPSDVTNWKKYVGDLENPKFKYGYKFNNPDAIYSNMLMFNFDRKNTDPNNTTFNKSSRFFLLPSVRAYLSFTLNKNTYSHYCAKTIDDANHYSPNIIPSAEIYQKETDSFGNSAAIIAYATNVNEEYKNIAITQLFSSDGYFGKIMNNHSNLGIEGDLNNYNSFFYKDGELIKNKDTTRFNIYTGLNAWKYVKDGNLFDATMSNFATDMPENFQESFNKYISGVNKWNGNDGNNYGTTVNVVNKMDGLTEMLSALAEKIEIDKSVYLNDNSLFTITLLTNGVENVTSGPYEKDMIDAVNNINNFVNKPNLFKIQQEYSINKQDFTNKQRTHDIDFAVKGWGSDYSDPLNTINTLTPGGAFDSVMTNSYSLAEKIKHGDNGLQENFKTLITKDVIAFIENSSGEMKTASANSNIESRYKSFANVENEIFYQYNISLPISSSAPEFTYFLSYLNPEGLDPILPFSNFFVLNQFDKLKTNTETEYLLFNKNYIKHCLNGNIATNESSYNEYTQNNWHDKNSPFSKSFTDFCTTWKNTSADNYYFNFDSNF